MKTTKFLFLFSFLIFSFSSAFAQDGIRSSEQRPLKKGFDPDRIVFSPSFGLWFGNTTYVNLNPSVGYRVTDRFIPGIGGTFIYFREKGFDPVYGLYYDYQTTIYGGSVFARYLILDNLFAHGEYEVLNAEVPVVITDPITGAQAIEYSRENIPALYLGGGYMQPIGRTSSLNLMVLFNFLHQQNSIYGNPTIRMGFNFGL